MKERSFWLLLLVALILAAAPIVMASCGDDDDDDNDGGGDDDDNDDDATDDDVADDDAADDDAADDDAADDDDDDATDDDDDDDDDTAGAGWYPPPAGASFVYDATEWTALEYQLTATVVGDDAFDDGTYTLIEMGDLDASDAIGLQTWFELVTEGEVGFKGANMYWTDLAKASGPPDGSFVMDEVIVIYDNPTEGVPQVSSADGTWSDPVYPNVAVSMEITSTTLDADATVTVPYGMVEGCRKVAVAIFEDFETTYVDRNVSATLYLHSDLGLVKIEGDFLFGFTLELAEVIVK